MYESYDDGMSDCPYNPSHRFQHKRYPYHIVKCSKKYPGITIKDCPFNDDHRIRSDMYEDHLRNCLDRGRVNPKVYSYQEPPKIHGDLSSPPPLPDFDFVIEDDWGINSGEPEPPVPNQNDRAPEPRKEWNEAAKEYGASRGLIMPDYGNQLDPNFTYWGDSPDDEAPQADGAVGAGTSGLGNPNGRERLATSRAGKDHAG